MRTVTSIRRRRIWWWIERGDKRLPEVEVNSDRMWCCPSCGDNGFTDGPSPRRIPLLGIGFGVRSLRCVRCGTDCRPRAVAW